MTLGAETAVAATVGAATAVDAIARVGAITTVAADGTDVGLRIATVVGDTAGGAVGTDVAGAMVAGIDVDVGIAGVLSPQAANTDPVTPAALANPRILNSVRRDSLNSQLLLWDNPYIMQFSRQSEHEAVSQCQVPSTLRYRLSHRSLRWATMEIVDHLIWPRRPPKEGRAIETIGEIGGIVHGVGSSCSA